MGRSYVQKAFAAAADGAKVLRLADFPKRARITARNPAPRGEILLFTGIRYERLTEPTASSPTDIEQGDGPASGSGRRKRRS